MDEAKLNDLLQSRTPGLIDAAGRYAVLVPLVRGEKGFSLLYEVRAKGMRRQPGEVCFPGGRMEGNESPEECALRETEEELSIPRSAIQVLGPLDFIVHRTNFILYPVLGLVGEDAVKHMRLGPAEVDEVFQVPLDRLMTVRPQEYSYKLVTQVDPDFPYEALGISRDYPWRYGRENGPIYSWEGHVIWGLTGKITRHLVRLLRENKI